MQKVCVSKTIVSQMPIRKISPCPASHDLPCPDVMGTKIVFITGTDTGVGKTLLTALLLRHLRARGARAVAIKPFCSGGRADAELLHELQDGELTLDEINPFYFPEPVAPLVSARKHHSRRISLQSVVQHIEAISARVGQAPKLSTISVSETKNSKLRTQNCLLIEGSGGLLVPLGEGYTVRDLIAALACDVIVVSRNQLGTINHTLLTAQALTHFTAHSALRTPHSVHSALKLVLMNTASRDPSCRSNSAILVELLAPIPLIQLPFLGPRCCSIWSVKKNAKKFHKTLAHLLL
jgi:dethiobiotin synthase